MGNTQEGKPHVTNEIDLNLPDAVTTPGAKLVYLYLFLENEATIDELHTALGLKKITLYSLLQTLTATDLVDRTDGKYVCQERPPDEEIDG